LFILTFGLYYVKILKMFPLEPLAAAKQAVSFARSSKLLPIDDGPVGDMVRDTIIEGFPLWKQKFQGFLYLASNEGWPGLHKIGCTRRTVERRLKSLNSAGVPTPWVAVQTWYVYDAPSLEAKIHRACSQWRVRSEIFNASKELLIEKIRLCLTQDSQILTRAAMSELHFDFSFFIDEIN
jgi:hypothetical protein